MILLAVLLLFSLFTYLSLYMPDFLAWSLLIVIVILLLYLFRHVLKRVIFLILLLGIAFFIYGLISPSGADRMWYNLTHVPAAIASFFGGDEVISYDEYQQQHSGESSDISDDIVSSSVEPTSISDSVLSSDEGDLGSDDEDTIISKIPVRHGNFLSSLGQKFLVLHQSVPSVLHESEVSISSPSSSVISSSEFSEGSDQLEDLSLSPHSSLMTCLMTGGGDSHSIESNQVITTVSSLDSGNYLTGAITGSQVTPSVTTVITTTISTATLPSSQTSSSNSAISSKSVKKSGLTEVEIDETEKLFKILLGDE